MRLSYLLPVLTACLAGADDWDSDTTVNQTAWREQQGLIRSVYRDVREDIGGVPSGYPVEDWSGTFRLTCESFTIQRDAGQPLVTRPSDAPGAWGHARYPESRQECTLSMRLGFAYGIGLELVGTGAHQSLPHADDSSWVYGDPGANLLIPLWITRYTGGTLVLGATAPLGSDTDWMQAHGGWSYVAGVRTACGLGMWTILGDLHGSFCDAGENTVPDPIAGDVTIKHALLSGGGGIAVSYRVATWLRVGVSQRGEIDTWTGRSTSKSILKTDQVVRAPALGVIDCEPATWFGLSGGYGADVTGSGGWGRRQIWFAAATLAF